MSTRHAAYDRVRWVEFRNASGEAVPPFGVVRIAGVNVGAAGRLLLIGEKPNAYGSQWSHSINGRLAVPPGRDGVCAVPEGPVLARLAPGGDVAAGRVCGPIDGSWWLHEHVGGFRMVGEAGGGRVLVVREPLLDLRVSLNEDLESGQTAEATPFYWSGTEWTAVEAVVVVREMMGLTDDVPENTVCTARWLPDAGFCVIAAGCGG